MSNRFITCLILTLSLTACSKSEEDSGAGNAGATQPSSGSALGEPSTGTTVSIAPPPTAAPAPMSPPGTAATAPAGIGSKEEYNGEVVARDDDGKSLKGEALLKKAMMFHVEGKGHPYPTRIEELVELGTLKSLPAAPAGQKWAIDPATKQIVLQ